MRRESIMQACGNALRQAAAAVTAVARPASVTGAKFGLPFSAAQQQPVMPGLRLCRGFREAVGSTPLLMLRSASEETGCTIWGKCEFLNPGGSVKDRPAVYMLKKAEKDGAVSPGTWVVEASAGNTAIALTLAAKDQKYRVICVMPDTQADEKKRMLRLLGAVVLPVPFQKVAHPNHYTRVAARLAQNLGGFYCGQFDNTANRQSHFETTGPEIWSQTGGKLDGFICAVGTGGTLAGVAASLRLHRREQLGYPFPPGEELHFQGGLMPHSLACSDTPLHEVSAFPPTTSGESPGRSSPVDGPRESWAANASLKARLAEVLASGGPCIGLADICGAGLYRLYTTGALKAEGNSIVENIGQNRVTGNLEGFFPDFACEIPDDEALTWTHRLLQEEGLPLGMTSGVNVAGAVRLARAMGPGHQIVTVLCDYGHLYSKKQWNPAFLRSLSLPEPTWMDENVPTDVLAALKASFVPTKEISTT